MLDFRWKLCRSIIAAKKMYSLPVWGLQLTLINDGLVG